MKKATVIFAALTALVFFFCSCSRVREDNDLSGLELPEITYTQTEANTRKITPSLYYLAENGSKFGIETRELTLKQDEDEAEAIIRTLLDTPSSTELYRPASGLSLERVERMKDLVNVYIHSTGNLSQQRRFIVSASVTNTLTDYLSVPYVCVFINDEPLLINGYPYGAMQKVSENIAEEYQQCLAKFESAGMADILLPIYFLDDTGKYLFPEIRTVSVEKHTGEADADALIGAALDELAVGPKVNYNLHTNFAQKTMEEDCVEPEYDDLIKRLKLNYSYAPCGENSQPDSTVCAAAYYTLANIIPEVFSLSIVYKGAETVVSRSVARTMLGNTITLYFPNTNRTALTAVSRTVYAEDAQKYRIYIRELLAGPLQKDLEYASECFPADYNTRDFHYIQIRGNTAYVDFGDSFAAMVARMDEDSEYLMFYSIVNTLCSVPRVKQVQFTVNGSTVKDTGGRINIEYPLMPNPGLLK